MLLASGAEPNLASPKHGRVALHNAASHGDADAVGLLLVHRADPSIADNDVRVSASPTARVLRGYGRAGTQNARPAEAVILSTGAPMPAQWA